MNGFSAGSCPSRLDGEDFPGVLGALARAGSGRTRALGGVAVVVTDQQIEATGTLALIDMSGPGAALGAFARTHNVAISAWPSSGTGRSEYLAAIRLAGLRVAAHLARSAGERAPDRVEIFDLPAPTRVPAEARHLPRVAYVFQIHSHQRPTGVDEGILYGDPVRRMVPGDVDGFFGLALDNLVQLLLIDSLCRFVLGFPPELVYGHVLPGAAVSILVGNLFYAWQAHRLAAANDEIRGLM